MENNTPPKESPVADQTPVQTAPVQPPEIKKGFPTKYLLLGVTAVLLVVASVGATLMVVSPHGLAPNMPEDESWNNAIPTQPVATSAPTTADLTTFTDENIEGMTFQYDPQEWEITEITPQNITLVPEGFNKVYGEAGVLLKEKNADGVLFMKYGYEVGRGGATGAIYEGHMKKLSKVARVKTQGQDYYIYGLNSTTMYDIFSEEPDKKKNYESLCAPDYDGYGMLSDEMCADLESGKIIGFYVEPLYGWSLKLNRIAEPKVIWGDVAYLGDLKPETVLIEAQYMGENPENADAVVTQLFD